MPVKDVYKGKRFADGRDKYERQIGNPGAVFLIFMACV